MESIWTKEIKLKRQGPLKGNQKAAAAVIGGGMAGLLTAYLLKEKGVEAVVLEAKQMASGQTKNTTAKITSQHGLIYHKLFCDMGLEKAAMYAHANESAIDEYRRLVKTLGISCEFQDCPAYLYSTMETGALEKEWEAVSQLGIRGELTTDTELPFPVKLALRFDGQARFHPLKFLSALSEHLTVYEDTPVLTVEENQIKTKQGTVTADHIVFATHYPFLNRPGYYFVRMHQERSYVLALKGVPELKGMYYGVDEGGLSFRSSGDCLLLGGGQHRTGENSGGGQYRMLRQKAASLYPGAKEAACWSAQDCMTLDNVPYIGLYSADTPSWYVATGFHKWGMTSSMVSAMILSDAITGKTHPHAQVFTPQRFVPGASLENLLKEGLQAVKGLARENFKFPDKEGEKLPLGHGGIVELSGEKVGVYKDLEGNLFSVIPRCPHLGCQLEWNPDEKSWDCPCHGSRFDYTGHLIDNPAQEDLYHGEEI